MGYKGKWNERFKNPYVNEKLLKKIRKMKSRHRNEYKVKSVNHSNLSDKDLMQIKTITKKFLKIKVAK